MQNALQLKVAGKLALNAADLSRFDGLAGVPLADVLAPTLLIVGGRDPEVLRINQDALRGLLSGSRRCTLALDLVLTRS